MIKRIAALLLTLLYAVTVCGVMFNLHYCGHLLTSVQIDAPANSCSKLAVKMKCCNDKQLQVKIKDAHQSAAFSFLAKTFVFDAPKPVFNARFFFASQHPAKHCINKAPPDITLCDIPAFIKTHAFRI